MQRGSFHRVLVLAPDVVARVATGRGRRDRVSREALALSLVAEAGLPLAVPLPLSEVADREGACGLLTSWDRFADSGAGVAGPSSVAEH